MIKLWKIIINTAMSVLVPISFITSTSWITAQAFITVGQRTIYSGSFTNTTYSLGGDVTIDMIFEQDNKVSGYVNFSNRPSENPICGAGNFQGTLQGRNLNFRFISSDPDPGCGFERGWVFIVNATLSHDGSRLENGTYQVNDTQAGVFQATLSNSMATSKVQNTKILNPQTPEELIQKIYQVHQPWANRAINLVQESVLSQYFDEELTRLFVRDHECFKKTGSICSQFEFDPFADTQNTVNGYLNLKLQKLQSNPNPVIEVTFDLVGRGGTTSYVKLIYHTRMTKAGWRISNIVYKGGKFSLKSSLSQTIRY